MTILSYLVLCEPGAAPGLNGRLAALPGCDVVSAQDHDLLLLVTESAGPEQDATLRERLQAMEGVSALVLTFGNVDPDQAMPLTSRVG